MSKKPQKRVKHIPQRTCIGCRTVLSKRTLIRIVRTDEGVKVDPTGKVPGRGAYIHGNHSCWERALKGPIGSALKTELTDADRMSLNEFMQSLPVEPETTNGEQQ